MTTTLREEIQNIIYMSIGKEKRIGITWIESAAATNEILKLFDKEIDGFIEQSNKRVKKINDSDQNEGSDYHNGWMGSIQYFKSRLRREE